MNEYEIMRLLSETDTHVPHKQMVYAAELCCNKHFISKLPPRMYSTACRVFKLLTPTGLLTKDDLEKALEVLLLYLCCEHWAV